MKTTDSTVPPRRRALFCTIACLLLAGLASIVIAPTARAQSYASPSAPPAGYTSDPLYVLGYLRVTLYTNVYPNDPNSDSYLGLQNAISFAGKNDLVLYFPPGTYYTSKPLRAYMFNYGTRRFALQGSRLGARPVIKLKTTGSGSSEFTNVNSVRPIIAIRTFYSVGTPAPAIPTDATINSHNPFSDFYDGSGTRLWKGVSVATLNGFIRDLDFDCSGYAGAVGVSFPASQHTALVNVKVTATGSYAGFIGVPDDGGGSTNLEVVGGRYGVRMDDYLAAAPGAQAANDGGKGGGSQGIYGLKLTNQTVSALTMGGGGKPSVVVGLDVTKDIAVTGAGSVITTENTGGTSTGVLTLVDGRITVVNGSTTIAIDNAVAKKNVYLRNIYFLGTTNPIKSDATTTTVANATSWWRVPEYNYREQNTWNGAAVNQWSPTLTSRTIVGTTGAAADITPTPYIPTTISSVTSPPSNLVSNHVPVVPAFDDDLDGVRTSTYIGDSINVKSAPYNATGDGSTDDRAAIQAAIDAAESTAHGRVLIPKGTYRIGNNGSNAGLVLKSKTKLFGIGVKTFTILRVHNSWTPAAGTTPILVDTQDSASAAIFVGFFTIQVRRDSPYDRFDHLRWRSGASSVLMLPNFGEDSKSGDQDPDAARRIMSVTGNGGGRLYFVSAGMRSYDSRSVLVKDTKVGHASQPLAFYTLNTEGVKQGTDMRSNTEITNSDNVRIFTSKREGTSPTLLVQNNSDNIGFYAFDMRTHTSDPDPVSSNRGAVKILGGNNDNILGASLILSDLMADHVLNPPLVSFREVYGANTLAVNYPAAISLFKRGNLDDSVMVFGGVTVPAAPSGLVATTVSTSQINLTWSDNSSNETGFEIDRATNSGFSTGLVTTTTSANPPMPYNSTPLAAGTTYYYRVRATNSAGNSAYSSTASATTQSVATPVKLTITASVAGGEQSGNGKANSYDGNAATRWASTGSLSTAWIQYDLGASKTVKLVKLQPYNGTTRTYPVRIEVGDGASSWTQVFNGNTPLGSGLLTLDVTDATNRYVKITMTAANSDGNGYLSFWEAEIWGN